MVEFEVAVTRDGVRMQLRVDAADEAQARRTIRRALGDGVRFDGVFRTDTRDSPLASRAPTGLPFLLEASAAGMTAVLLRRLSLVAEEETRALVSAR